MGRAGTIRKVRSAVAAVALAGVLCAAAAGLAEEAAPESGPFFTFNPPEGALFSQTLRVTRITQVPGKPHQTTTIEQKSRLQPERGGEGFTVNHTIYSVQWSTNGAPLPEMLSSVLQDTALVYDVDANGRLLGVVGLDALENRIRTLPEESARALSAMVDVPSVRARLEYEWRTGIEALLGKPARVGTTVVAEGEFPTPGGKLVTVRVTSRVMGWVVVAGRQCVRIRLVYEMPGGSVRVAPKGKAPAKPPRQPVPWVSGRGERVMDPVTMIVFHESVYTLSRGRMEVPGRGTVVATVKEWRNTRTEPGEGPNVLEEGD